MKKIVALFHLLFLYKVSLLRESWKLLTGGLKIAQKEGLEIEYNLCLEKQPLIYILTNFITNIPGTAVTYLDYRCMTVYSLYLDKESLERDIQEIEELLKVLE